MQKLIAIFITLSLMGALLLFGGFTFETDERSELFRIHIIANSNSEEDSILKYKIKDAFTSFLQKGIEGCDSKSDVNAFIKDNISNLTIIANNIASENNFNYKSKIKITNEYFPSRVYGEYVVESGYYDGLTVVLGEGKGDNWWCVLFPPLCFYNGKIANSNSIVYKSKILEIIKKFYRD